MKITNYTHLKFKLLNSEKIRLARISKKVTKLLNDENKKQVDNIFKNEFKNVKIINYKFNCKILIDDILFIEKKELQIYYKKEFDAFVLGIDLLKKDSNFEVFAKNEKINLKNEVLNFLKI